MMRNVCLCTLFVAFVAASVSAQVWYVDPAGSSDPDGSFQQPFETIQDALDAVQDGDAIVLMPGVYSGPGNYDLESSGLSLTIRSVEPTHWDVTASTVIDPQGQGGIFVFTNGQGVITLEGLTFQNAVNVFPPHDEPHGAAIFTDGVVIDIRYCVFRNCQASLGGAIYFYDTQAALSHCLFEGNDGWDGGALIGDWGSAVTVEHCTFAGNSADFFGGAAALEFGSTLSVTNSIFWGNGLIEAYGKGTQIYAADASVVSVAYSVVADGIDGVDVDAVSSEILFGEGVFDADPLFVSFDPQQSPSAWDLRLQSVFGRWSTAAQDWVFDAVTSPCIAAGSMQADYSLEPWPNGRRANLGAYGNTAHASRYGNIADLNIDGRVDMLDLAMVAAVWMEQPNDYEDFDNSGLVDAADLLILAENWLWSWPVP